jgi:hypothetical protein
LLGKKQTEITFSFDDFGIANPYLKSFVSKYSTALRQAEERETFEYEKDSQKLNSIAEDYNQKLLQNPYNVKGEKINDYTKMKRDGDREENYEESLKSIENEFKRLNRIFEQKLREENPTEYIRIYYSQNPSKKTEADGMYMDCRCGFKSRAEFDWAFITDIFSSQPSQYRASRCGCREKLYSGKGYDYTGAALGEYFSDRAEFGKYYDQGKEIFNQEVERREAKYIVKKLITNHGPVVYKFGDRTEYAAYKDGTYYVAGKSSLIAYISKNKDKQYYSEIIEVAIENYKELDREWAKNGQVFKNKTEFYEAYILDNYKQILKEKKKK